MTTTSGGRPPGRCSRRQPMASQTSQGAVVAPSLATPDWCARQRRVRMTVNRIDPWTVLRLSFLLSLAAAIITVVAVAMLLWAMLSSAGVFSSVDGTLSSQCLGDGALTITQYFGFGRVFSVVVADRCHRRRADYGVGHDRRLLVQPRGESDRWARAVGRPKIPDTAGAHLRLRAQVWGAR